VSSPALDPARSASVAASAGSGKTWLLTARILRLLLAGAAPGGILALSFTRKAAAEMRLRVNRALHDLAKADDAALEQGLRQIGADSDAATRQRARRLYREQLFNPWPLRCTTLHAFCQDLVSRFAFEAAVTPGFKLVEQAGSLYDQAWRQLQRRMLYAPRSPAALAFAELIALGYGEYRLRQTVRGFLQRRSDWRALGEDPLPRLLAELRGTLGVDENDNPDAPVLGDAFNFYLKELIGLFGKREGINKVKTDRLVAARDASAGERLDLLQKALFTQKLTAFEFSPGKTFTPAQKQALEQNHGEVVRAIETALRRRNAQRSLRRNRAALTLCSAALAAFDALLARENALTFDEIEGQALTLLTREGGADWVRYKLDQKIEHLLLDEFQDTNPTQWRLLLPLLEEMAAGDSGRARSVFIVGDAKQSIYGFRRARPELLDAAAGWLRERLNAVSEQQTRTWRSAPAVVDFINALFAGARAEEIGFVPHSTARTQDWGQVEVAPLIGRDDAPEALTDLRDPLTTPRRKREETRAQREAEQVASRIRALLASGATVREAGGARPMNAGDVLVLARQRKHLIQVERALSALGIPYSGAARGTLLDTAEARDLTALLRFLDAPHRNLELAQVLRSPLFSLDDGALMALASAGAPDWAAALTASAEPRFERAARLLQGWRGLAATLPVHDLLDRIVSEADAARRYESALPPAARARVRANLGAFLQLALTADSGRYPSLGSFLTFVEQQAALEREAPDEAAPVADAAAVRILTIHAAKGLEAAAVFVVNTGNLSGRQQAAPWLVDWPADQARPTVFLALGNKDERDSYSAALLEQQKAREARETLNLLYVAVTRARQFLHLSGFVSGKSESGASWHAFALQALQTLGVTQARPFGLMDGTATYGSGVMTPAEHPQSTAPAPAPDERLRRPLQNLPRPHTPPSGPSRPAFDPDAAARGTALHAALKTLSENPAARVTEGREQALAVIKAPALRRFFTGVRAWNEIELSGIEGDGGIADRIVDDGDTIWVLDYKTTAAPDAAELRERYRSQIEDYLRAARSIWPHRRVRGGLVLTADQSFVEIS